MRTLLSWLSLGTLALAGLPAPSGAQPVGSEFQINTYTTRSQEFPAVAADTNGNFVVVWSGYGQGDSYLGIFGQRYDSAGAALGGEFRVNSYTTGQQIASSVAGDASGNFVVVWSSFYLDGSESEIFGRRFDNHGVPQGREFRVNSYTTSTQKFSSVAADASGNFVVVWQSIDQDGSSYGVFGQRFDSGGVPQGGEFRVNSFTRYTQFAASVASDASGNFVVVWSSSNQFGDGLYDVFGQRYDSAGQALGSEFLVNSYTPSDQYAGSVASDPRGNFVVVWSGGGQGDSYHGIFAQRFDSAGVPQGGEFRVNSYTTHRQSSPSVASDASGNFVVVWDSYGQDGSADGVFGQRYDSDGVPQGGEFRVNSYTTDTQYAASVASDASGDFVVVWQSLGQDGSGWGVFGQRFNFAGDTITVVSPNTNVKWRIGSVEKIQWTHNLGPEATFRIELDRDDDGEYEELIAAEAPVDSATKGSFAWTVTGPPSGTARVRVSWTDDLTVSDSSDVTFQIRPVGLD